MSNNNQRGGADILEFQSFQGYTQVPLDNNVDFSCTRIV